MGQVSVPPGPVGPQGGREVRSIVGLGASSLAGGAGWSESRWSPDGGHPAR